MKLLYFFPLQPTGTKIYFYSPQRNILLNLLHCALDTCDKRTAYCRWYLYYLSQIWLTLKLQFVAPCQQSALLFLHSESSFEIKASSLGTDLAAVTRQRQRLRGCGGGLLLWKLEVAGTMLSHGELQLRPPPPSYVAHSSADRDGGIELDYVSFYYRFTLYQQWLRRG